MKKYKLYEIDICGYSSFKIVSDLPTKAIDTAKDMYVNIMRRDSPSFSVEKADANFRSMKVITDVDAVLFDI